MKIAKLLSLAMMLGAFAFALTSCGQRERGPSDVVRSYLSDLQSGNVERAFGLFYFGEEDYADELSALVEKYELSLAEIGGIQSFELPEGGETISEDGLTAKVIAQVTYGDGSSEKIAFQTVNVDGTWKLDISSLISPK